MSERIRQQESNDDDGWLVKGEVRYRKCVWILKNYYTRRSSTGSKHCNFLPKRVISLPSVSKMRIYGYDKWGYAKKYKATVALRWEWSESTKSHKSIILCHTQPAGRNKNNNVIDLESLCVSSERGRKKQRIVHTKSRAQSPYEWRPLCVWMLMCARMLLNKISVWSTFFWEIKQKFKEKF